MPTPTNGKFIDSYHRGGFGLSLMEVLVSLIILSIFLGVITLRFPGIKRMFENSVSQVTIEENYLVFLVVFEKDYKQAEVMDQLDLENLNRLIFQSDFNLDGDRNDSAESIQYRWNQSKSRMDRKSGKGYFQAFLDGIDGFSWYQVSESPLCHQMTISTVFSNTDRIIEFCRTAFLAD